MQTVVTSFSPDGWKQYAKTFVETFYQHFPAETRLLAYREGDRPHYEGLLAGHDLLQLKASSAFISRHADNLVVKGRQEGEARWSGKARSERYSYRHDAYKFARKVFAVADAAYRTERGKLFWIDADVVVLRDVPSTLLDELLPDDVSLCYLPRRDFHSELGFVGYNLDRLETHAFITAYEAEYAMDKFLSRPHWDDCSVFDALVAELRPDVKPISSTSRGQPFDSSVLGQYMRHNKGKRKDAGTQG